MFLACIAGLGRNYGVHGHPMHCNCTVHQGTGRRGKESNKEFALFWILREDFFVFWGGGRWEVNSWKISSRQLRLLAV